ncbi:unnamed protein product, partial [Porites lobata]
MTQDDEPDSSLKHHILCSFFEINYPQIVAASALNLGLVFWFHLFQNGGFISPRWFPPSFQGMMVVAPRSFPLRFNRTGVVLQDSFQGDVITMLCRFTVEDADCSQGVQCSLVYFTHIHRPVKVCRTPVEVNLTSNVVEMERAHQS